MKILAIIFLLGTPVLAEVPDRVLNMILLQEGGPVGGRIHDKIGYAYGPYCLHRIYWEDVNRFAKTRYTSQDAVKETSREIVRKYLTHYGRIYKRRTGATFVPDRVYLMFHNGGGSILYRKNSLPYRRAESYAFRCLRLSENVLSNRTNLKEH